MARLRPPQHSVDDPCVYISEEDDAWDHERINKELKNRSAENHPVKRYWDGDTRQRLTPEAEAYLDRSKNPEVWKIKRLKAQPFMRVQGMIGNQSTSEAFLEAFRYGVESVENSPIAIRTMAGRVKEDILDKICESDPSIITDVGLAIYIASQPLDEAEKKA